MRLFLASLGVALFATSAAHAEIVIGDFVYPDSDLHKVRQYCAGLDAQSRQSLISTFNDDDYNGDLASEYQLKSVPFTLRDCRRAGLV